MKKRFLKSIGILLALLMLFSSVSCRDQKNNDISSDMEMNDGFLPNSAFKMIYGDLYATNADLCNATDHLKTAFLATYGISLKTRSDATIGFVEPSNYEIIVGDSNRPQSAQLMQSLGLNDYVYLVESEKTIVICGGSPAATYEGVKKFCSDILGYDENVTNVNRPIVIGKNYTYRASYEHQSTTLNGIPLTEYTIAVSDRNHMELAVAMASELGQYSGVSIPVIRFEGLTGNEKALIGLGLKDRSNLYELPKEGYAIHTYADEIGTVLCVAASNRYVEQALHDFVGRMEVEKTDQEICLSVAECDEIFYGFTDEIDRWILDSEINTEIAEGVVLVEKLYYNRFNVPFRVHALIVDPVQNQLYMGSTADGYDYSLENMEKQDVQEHMEAAVKNGRTVLAGINADFFVMNGDYHPLGLTIKEGELISQTVADRPFFGIAYDGTVVISTGLQYSSAMNLRTAVGGSDILVRNGYPYSIGSSENSYGGVEPRTMAGVRADGCYVLAVIDGRQRNISNGASYARCALVMMELGCTDAINLDGGGSTSMVLRDPTTDTYTVQNSPSGGSLRKVYNSLLVVKKE